MHCPTEIRLAGVKKGDITRLSTGMPSSEPTKMTITAPTQISLRRTEALKKKRGLRERKIVSMMSQPSRPGIGSSWKAKSDRFRKTIALTRYAIRPAERVADG